MASTVMTVNGPISADKLGFTSPHEHIYLDLMRDNWSGNNFLNDPELAYEELMYFKRAGGVTAVDLTSGGLKENDQQVLPIKHPLAIREMAKRTGLNIILGCGWYRETYYAQYLWRAKTDQIAEEIIRDVTVGIDGTDVKAGVIGEIGAHFTWLSPVEERVLRAAARAQKKTGVAFATHATRGPVGLDQLDILKEEGADLSRVVIAHSCSYPNLEYQLEIAKRGAYLSFDSQGAWPEHAQVGQVKLLKQVLDAGLVKQVHLSHDICYRSMYHAYGGGGYDFIPTKLFPVLKKIGVSDEQIHIMTVENPRRWLTGEG